jgi:surface antigen
LLTRNDHDASRYPLYKGSIRLSLSRLPARLAVAIAAVGAISVAACSLPLDSMFDKNDAASEQVGATGSIDRALQSAEAVGPSESDLAHARAAAADAIAREGNDSSTPWSNPESGASGNITPLGRSYAQGDLRCRGFLASFTNGPAQAWLQGEACRMGVGKWEVKNLRPLSQG